MSLFQTVISNSLFLIISTPSSFLTTQIRNKKIFSSGILHVIVTTPYLNLAKFFCMHLFGMFLYCQICICNLFIKLCTSGTVTCFTDASNVRILPSCCSGIPLVAVPLPSGARSSISILFCVCVVTAEGLDSGTMPRNPISVVVFREVELSWQ